MSAISTYITVTLQVEGLHCWPDAAKHEPNADYLQYPHRHIFHIKAVKKVSHDDRDVEIIEFKRTISSYLYQTYFDKNRSQTEYQRICDFGGKSCEMLAHELMLTFNLEQCEVLEDGENGAMVSLNQTLPIIRKHQNWDIGRIRFVFGGPCVGKGTYIENLKQSLQAEKCASEVVVIAVSDIVRKVSGLTSTHDLMHKTDHLHLHIARELKQQIIANVIDRDDVILIIDGLRQHSVFQEIIAMLENLMTPQIGFTLEEHFAIDYIWLNTSQTIAKQRFYDRQRKTDSMTSFDEVQRATIALGFLNLHKDLINRGCLKELQNV